MKTWQRFGRAVALLCGDDVAAQLQQTAKDLVQRESALGLYRSKLGYELRQWVEHGPLLLGAPFDWTPDAVGVTLRELEQAKGEREGLAGVVLELAGQLASERTPTDRPDGSEAQAGADGLVANLARRYGVAHLFKNEVARTTAREDARCWLPREVSKSAHAAAEHPAGIHGDAVDGMASYEVRRALERLLEGLHKHGYKVLPEMVKFWSVKERSEALAWVDRMEFEPDSPVPAHVKWANARWLSMMPKGRFGAANEGKTPCLEHLKGGYVLGCATCLEDVQAELRWMTTCMESEEKKRHRLTSQNDRIARRLGEQGIDVGWKHGDESRSYTLAERVGLLCEKVVRLRDELKTVHESAFNEGRSDVAVELRKAVDPEDKHHWNLDGTLAEVRRLVALEKDAKYNASIVDEVQRLVQRHARPGELVATTVERLVNDLSLALKDCEIIARQREEAASQARVFKDQHEAEFKLHEETQQELERVRAACQECKRLDSTGEARAE